MGEVFSFKQFTVGQERCAMKVGTDGVLLGAWARGGRMVLDVGCGTGVIALMMAQRFPESRITAIDIVEDCCVQTEENAARSPFAGRVEVVCRSLQDFGRECAAAGRRFDAVVSNPPFFVRSMKNPDTLRSLARHADALPFAELLPAVSQLLEDDGVFSAIVPSECCNEFIAEALYSGLYLAQHVAVKTVARKDPRRHLLLFSKQRPESLLQETQVLQEGEGRRSEWYGLLTKDFYL